MLEQGGEGLTEPEGSKSLKGNPQKSLTWAYSLDGQLRR